MEFLSDDIHQYISEHTTEAPEFLNELERETWVKVVMPRMLSGHVQGQILKTFSLMMRPKYVLEVGTFIGYASHFLVEGLQEEENFHAIEINEELESIGYQILAEKQSLHQMNLHIGPATSIIPTLSQPWDLIFLDADKIGLKQYYDLLVPQNEKGSIMLIDNILWSGKVVEEVSKADKDTKAIGVKSIYFRRFTCGTSHFGVRDGIMMVRKL